MLLDAGRDGEDAGIAHRSARQSGQPRRIVQESEQLVRDRRRVVDRNDDTVAAPGRDFGTAADVGGDKRQAGHGRFEQSDRQSFPRGCHQE